MKHVLRFSGNQKSTCYDHLFPGDGKEAMMLLLCGRHCGRTRHVLTVWKIVPVPYEICDRSATHIEWPTDFIIPSLEEAARKNLAIVKLHCHPGGHETFSECDDVADVELMTTVHALVGDGEPHGSAVMLPDGKMFGRVVTADANFEPIDLVAIAGKNIGLHWIDECSKEPNSSLKRNEQTFGPKTTNIIRRLKVGIAGVSGTGGPLSNQLMRFEPDEIVLVDPKDVRDINLNRIPNAFAQDAKDQVPKVDVQKLAIEKLGFDTRVIPMRSDLNDPEVIRELAECDIVFGCMDSADGRHTLNKLCSYYLIPYFDLGIGIDADGEGGLSFIGGTVHYLQPDGSSLLSRRVYSMDEVRSEAMLRTNPEEYGERVAEKYIKGVDVERPAVTSLNTLVSSWAMLEMLARIHPFRDDDNDDYACVRFSLKPGVLVKESDGKRCMAVTQNAGRGDVQPLLGMPILSEMGEREHVS